MCSCYCTAPSFCSAFSAENPSTGQPVYPTNPSTHTKTQQTKEEEEGASREYKRLHMDSTDWFSERPGPWYICMYPLQMFIFIGALDLSSAPRRQQTFDCLCMLLDICNFRSTVRCGVHFFNWANRSMNESYSFCKSRPNTIRI
jgi:hypothetical protein